MAAPMRDAKGKFIPGHRALKLKGSVHTHAILKEKLSVFVKTKLDQLPKLWAKLSHRDRARLLADLLPYVMQKQSNVEITALTEPTKDAIARLFDFGDPEDVQLWVEDRKEKVFPKQKDNQ